MAGTTESLDLGPVSAYAVAVANGYTGTEEQWTQAIANASVNGQNAVQAKLAAEEYAQQAQEAKTDAVAAAAHYPKVQNGFWYLWDDGQYVNTNIKAEGVDGVTFTPSVSAAGVLSWTNNGDLPNPEPVNIKGDPGQNTQIHICTASEYDAVSRVPTILEPDETVFYLVPASDGAGADLYTEWIYANNAWEVFGSAKIDLTAWQNMLAPEEVSPSEHAYAVGELFRYDGVLYKATAAIAIGDAITPGSETGCNCEATQIAGEMVQDVQVNGTSVVTNGVANVPVASQTVFGVIKVNAEYGIQIGADGLISTYPAAPSDIKSGGPTRPVISPTNQHISAFYGLAKAAGYDEKNSTLPVGQYTESAKSAISEMLNGSVTVSGTTPIITALPGVRYVCGECSTLDITLPASGCIDVTFESGSTATVLTITPPSGQTVKWANGFDPTALEANTTYEINIFDGLGVAGAWT